MTPAPSNCASHENRHWHPWLLPALALAALLLATGIDLAAGIWRQPEHAYQPMLTLLALALLAWECSDLEWKPPPRLSATAHVALTLGLAAYALGRSQSLELIEASACVALLAAVGAIAGGQAVWRRMRFGLLILLLALPWPAWIVDNLTGPLKAVISLGVETLLYAAGYPVARSGVMLSLGPYRLLVADACSGLHSLIFLAALDLLYLRLSGPRPRWQQACLLAAMLPIAVLANGVRVLALALTTYHLGDAAGQGLWHDSSGLLLYAFAFVTLFALDALLTRVSAALPPTPAPASSVLQPRAHPQKAEPTAPIWPRSLLLTGSLLLAGALSLWLTPRQSLPAGRPAPMLDQIVPRAFGAWQEDREARLALVTPDVAAELDRVYGQTLSRVYVDGNGQRIMLAIAYGSRQLGNALQAHRPEYCYQAQGFVLLQAH
ncbi:MAG: exosortase, partial [Pseudomonadota bacterium]